MFNEYVKTSLALGILKRKHSKVTKVRLLFGLKSSSAMSEFNKKRSLYFGFWFFSFSVPKKPNA